MAKFSGLRPLLCALIFVLIQVPPLKSSAQLPDAENKDISAPLKKAQEQAEQQTQALSDLEEAEKQAESEQSKARERKALAEQKAKAARESGIRILNEYLAELEGYRENLALIKKEKSERGQAELKHIRDLIDEVREIDGQNLAQTSRPLREKYYVRANTIWREIVDRTLSDLLADTDDVDAPELPSPPEAFKTSGKDEQELIQSILEAQQQAEKERAELISKTEKLRRSAREISVGLLLSAGQVRAETLSARLKANEMTVWHLDEDWLRDLAREVQIVPYRFLAFFIAKFFEMEKKVTGGIRGWVDLARQLFLLLILLVSPFFLFKSFTRFSKFLDNWRTKLFTRSSLDFKTRTTLALWINRLNPYLPWIFALISLWLISGLLKSTDLKELSSFLPYIGIYLYYRIFRMALSGVMGRILLSRNLDTVRAKQKEVQATSRRLSILFFSEWALLHATQDMVREAIIYHMVWDLVVYLNLFLIAIEARKWKDELLIVSDSWLPQNAKKLVNKNTSRLLDLVVCPILFTGSILSMLLNGFFKWLGQFDLGKKISSELFKRRLEDAVDGEDHHWEKPPEEYLHLFDEGFEVDDATRVFLSRSPLSQCQDIINRWLTGKSEMDSIVLYGNYGIGKTALLKSIASKTHDKLMVKYHCFNSKITDPFQLYGTLSELLGFPIKSEEDFREGEKNIAKTVLLLDDIHNLFLNKLGGLEAYKALINIVSIQAENVFWCVAINERAWVHLRGVFGATHIMAEYIELKQWSDSEIQDLIMKRHRKSGLQLKFDRVISAVQKTDIIDASTELEAQFFRLLWGQSRGNPSTAQELWQSATQKRGTKNIRVGVPEFTRARTLSDATESTLLAFAALAKHESLAFEELMETSGMSKSDLQQAIKFGEDGGLLDKTKSGRWRIHPKAQYVVCSHLIGRNFIYE